MLELEIELIFVISELRVDATAFAMVEVFTLATCAPTVPEALREEVRTFQTSAAEILLP